MRDSAPTFLICLIISMTIFTVAEPIGIGPSTIAALVSTPWRPYGPYFGQVAVKVGGSPVLTGFAGLVNVSLSPGALPTTPVTLSGGFASTFNWFNARPNIGGPGVLSVGITQATKSLSIFQAGTLSEGSILFNLLDTPGHFNPSGGLTTPNPFFNPYEAMVIAVGQLFCTVGTTCASALGQPGFTVPGVPASENVTVIQLVFRNDILFHDGVQLTAKDLLASGLAYRDVPPKGFGLAAAWANFLQGVVPIPGSNCGDFCVQLVFDGQSDLNRLNALATPILPLHVWDTDGDGFICSDLGLRSCDGRVADFSTPACNLLARTRGNAAAIAAGCIEVTSSSFDPMPFGFLIGSGPFQCLDLDLGTPGGSCSRTGGGSKGGQGIGLGGSFLLTRFDGYLFCCPTDPNGGTLSSNTPLGRFAAADLVHAAPSNWHIDSLDLSAAVATGNSRLILTVVGQLGDSLGGLSGTTLFNVDLSNAGNAYTIGYLV